jgi:hypothetical protein
MLTRDKHKQGEGTLTKLRVALMQKRIELASLEKWSSLAYDSDI